MASMDVEYTGYTLVRDLGSGNFGVTKLYRDDTTGELVAVKFLKRGKAIEDNLAYVEREILNHMQLSGQSNIVQFKEVFLTTTHLGIAMEFAAGGELFDRIAAAGRFSEDVARYFFQQLIAGVAWCHSNGVCHRDLKLENSLLDKKIDDAAVLHVGQLIANRPLLKICDFGYSKSAVFDSQPKSTVGTPAYIAPEVLNRKEYDGEVADVWSCGVTLYVMLVGAYPFEDPVDPRNFKKTIERIVDVKYSIPYDIPLSHDCLDLISRIFQADPSKRITLAQIKQHPWFLKNLPPELQGGDLGMLETQPKFAQTEDEIRQLISMGCTLVGGELENPKRGLPDEYMYGDSINDQYVDQYFDTGSGGLADDELMYMRSGGAGCWNPEEAYGGGLPLAPPSPSRAQAGSYPAAAGGTQPAGAAGSPAMREVMAGMGGLGITQGRASTRAGRPVDPDLAFELGEYDDDF